MQRTPYLSPYLHFLTKAAPEHTPNCASAWVSTSCGQGWATSEQTNTERIHETTQIQGLRASFQPGSAGTDKPTASNTQADYTLQNRSRTLAHICITHLSSMLPPRYSYLLAMLDSLRLSWLYLYGLPSYVWIMLLLCPERVWDHNI